MENFFDKFKLDKDKEELITVIAGIEQGVVFRGTNLWILIMAIFVASLGLNVNSTAVIIGAMLISPLMGPIMGMGLGMGINDLALLRKALYNFAVATGVALVTSTIFFSLSPLDDAHSEILARTAPNIYDVLIALFGGFAGIIATMSKQKGNVIPGVAIATALMPPLCTAGYGIATLQFNFFFGAFYLFVINTVFIALATLIAVRLLHFPYKHLQTARAEKIAKRVVWVVVVITLIPSLYFGYDLVQQSRFTKQANLFIGNEAHFTNDYLLSKKVDAKTKSIALVFGGKEILPEEIAQLKKALNKYSLQGTRLEVKQGFAYLAEANNNQTEEAGQLKQAMALQGQRVADLQSKLDSVEKAQAVGKVIFDEIKAQYPTIKSIVVQPARIISTEAENQTTIVVLSFSRRLSLQEKERLGNWLKVRLKQPAVNLVFQ